MAYTDGQIRDYIREVVRETKSTARVDTGFLKRSIKGDLMRNKSVEFREIFYGAYNENAKLVENATRIMPKDIPWKVIFVDEEGRETVIKGVTQSGRTISRKQITNENVSTNKIKALIKYIRDGQKKNDTGKGDRGNDKEKSERDR